VHAMVGSIGRTASALVAMCAMFCRRALHAAAAAGVARLLTLSLLWVFACSSVDADEAPADVLARFLEAMDRSSLYEGALRDAYALLDEQAQHELSARAVRAGSLTGRKFEAWEMIAQGRFRLRFALAEHGEMHTKVAGDKAFVQVKSDDALAQASVPLVREGGRWRVRLLLPELARAATAEPSPR
jgi:hypothetical protein